MTYDENELPAIEEHGPDKRTLVIRGGYCRDEVYFGICRTKDDLPDELIAVDGTALKRILRSMVIGTRTERAHRRKQRT